MKKFLPNEKKLVCWMSEQQSLLSLPVTIWRDLASQGKTKIISEAKTSSCISFILSESSLFVWQDHFLMITCGNGEPLETLCAVEQLTDKTISGFLYVPNKLNNTDTSRLKERFPDFNFTIQGGEIFGATKRITYPSTTHLMMSDFPESIRTVLFSGSRLQIRRLFADIFTDYLLDDHRFEPHGYSINGIKEDDYITVHITPQMPWNCMSFETNSAKAQRYVESLLESLGPNHHKVQVSQPFCS